MNRTGMASGRPDVDNGSRGGRSYPTWKVSTPPTAPASAPATPSSSSTGGPASAGSRPRGSSGRFVSRAVRLDEHGRAIPRRCAACGTSNTTQWRTGPRELESLCNACGIRLRRSTSPKPPPTLAASPNGVAKPGATSSHFLAARRRPSPRRWTTPVTPAAAAAAPAATARSCATSTPRDVGSAPLDLVVLPPLRLGAPAGMGVGRWPSPIAPPRRVGPVSAPTQRPDLGATSVAAPLGGSGPPLQGGRGTTAGVGTSSREASASASPPLQRLPSFATLMATLRSRQYSLD